jgi:hypothetical protein
MTYKWKITKSPKSKKDKMRTIVVVVGILAVLALLCVSFQKMQEIFTAGPFAKLADYLSLIPELSTTGYVQVNISAGIEDGKGLVFLTSGCYQIIANTDEWQAQSIANGLEGYVGFRPGTHDLVKDAMEQLDIEVVMVKVTEVRNSTFFGRLILRQGNRILSLDARPSDATAIAVRMGAPVYVNEKLMEEYGEKVC